MTVSDPLDSPCNVGLDPALAGRCDDCGAGDGRESLQRRNVPDVRGDAAQRGRRRHHWLCAACCEKRLNGDLNRQRAAALFVIALVGVACVGIAQLAGVTADRAPWRDTGILLAAYAVALAGLFAAYEGGGRAWLLRYGHIVDGVRGPAVDAEPVGGLVTFVARMIGLAQRRGTRAGAKPPRHGPRRLPRPQWVLRTRFTICETCDEPQDQAESGARPAAGSGLRSLSMPEIPPQVRARAEAASAVGRSWKSCYSGFWGEALIVSLAVAICIIVVWQCGQGNIVGVLQSHPINVVVYVVLAFAALVIADYSLRQVDTARRNGRSGAYVRSLARAYAPYAVYSWLIFAFGAILLGVLTQEFFAFADRFENNKAEVRCDLSLAAYTLDPTDVIKARAIDGCREPPLVAPENRSAMASVLLERAYGRLSHANLSLQKQLNPIFLFAALLVMINILITHTRLRQLFENDARTLTFLFTYLPLGLVALVGAYVYKSSYEGLMQMMVQGLSIQSFDYRVMSLEQVKRLQEISSEVTRSNNIFGFAQAVSGSGSGAAAFIWFVKEVLDRASRSEDGVDHANKGRRPHPRFRSA